MKWLSLLFLGVIVIYGCKDSSTNSNGDDGDQTPPPPVEQLQGNAIVTAPDSAEVGVEFNVTYELQGDAPVSEFEITANLPGDSNTFTVDLGGATNWDTTLLFTASTQGEAVFRGVPSTDENNADVNSDEASTQLFQIDAFPTVFTFDFQSGTRAGQETTTLLASVEDTDGIDSLFISEKLPDEDSYSTEVQLQPGNIVDLDRTQQFMRGGTYILQLRAVDVDGFSRNAEHEVEILGASEQRILRVQTNIHEAIVDFTNGGDSIRELANENGYVEFTYPSTQDSLHIIGLTANVWGAIERSEELEITSADTVLDYPLQLADPFVDNPRFEDITKGTSREQFAAPFTVLKGVPDPDDDSFLFNPLILGNSSTRGYIAVDSVDQGTYTLIADDIVAEDSLDVKIIYMWDAKVAGFQSNEPYDLRPIGSFTQRVPIDIIE